MLSPADVIIIGAVALIVFGPEQLPKVARRAGQVMRDVQNTSQTFIREMERAADEGEHKDWTPPASPVEHYADPTPAPGVVEPPHAADTALDVPVQPRSAHAQPGSAHAQPGSAHAQPGSGT